MQFRPYQREEPRPKPDLKLVTTRLKIEEINQFI